MVKCFCQASSQAVSELRLVSGVSRVKGCQAAGVQSRNLGGTAEQRFAPTVGAELFILQKSPFMTAYVCSVIRWQQLL